MRVLKGIFYSRFDAFPDWEALSELDRLIKEGVVGYKAEKAFPKSAFLRLVGSGAAEKVETGPGRELNGHLALKKLARQCLENKGKRVLVERNFCGLVPDLITADEGIVIECGNASPSKVLSYLALGVDKVGIMPVPFVGDKDVSIHWFGRTNKFGGYLKGKTAQLKKVHRKFHRGNR